MGRPEPGPGAEATRFERVISGEGWIVAAALAAAVLLAWVWLWLAPPGAADMAGMAMMPATPVEPWRAAYLAAAFAMWTLMMVAMMLPSAAPMILLYSRFARKAVPSPFAYLAAFVLAYLAVWTLFSALAATAQAGLVAAGLVPAMTLALGNVRLAGALLLLAGLYQLSPLKRACLDQCRSPLSFIMRHSRPGPRGAWRLGLIHGLYCLGCCWALMALLFVGGVMNLAWIAALAILVLAEKVAPAPPTMRRLTGGGLVLAAMLFLLAGCAKAPAYDPAAEEAAIRQVIANMERAWNRGDFRGYMAGFKNPDVVFVSRGRFQRDWQGTLDHYVRDYGGDPARRGRLHFFDIRVEMLSPDAAQLISRYRLEGGGSPQDGVNTRLMRKVDGRWVIALNHVSSAEVAAPQGR